MKKAFIIIAILLESLSCGGMAENMSDELKEVYGGAIVPMEGDDDFENPPATVGVSSASRTPAPVQMGHEVQKGLNGGQPVFKVHENIYQEGIPHGLDSIRTFVASSGTTDEVRATYFGNSVPLDKAFRITEISENISLDSRLANINDFIVEYFIVQDRRPIYHGRINVVYIPNNGVVAINTLYFFHKISQKIDIWIPQQSRLGIVTRLRIQATNATSVGNYNLNMQGYLATPPYPLGKGQNNRFSGNVLTFPEWNSLINSFNTF